MDSENLTTTVNSIQQTRRSCQSTKGSASLSKRLKNQRMSSEQTDSTATFIDHANISAALNNYKLKFSLSSIYATDPTEKLKEILKDKGQSTPKASVKHQRKTSAPQNRKKRSRCDSMFREKEAELIRDELSTIKSPEVWSKLIQNFKQTPTVLMDLVPIE